MPRIAENMTLALWRSSEEVEKGILGCFNRKKITGFPIEHENGIFTWGKANPCGLGR